MDLVGTAAASRVKGGERGKGTSSSNNHFRPADHHWSVTYDQPINHGFVTGEAILIMLSLSALAPSLYVCSFEWVTSRAMDTWRERGCVQRAGRQQQVVSGSINDLTRSSSILPSLPIDTHRQRISHSKTEHRDSWWSVN